MLAECLFEMEVDLILRRHFWAFTLMLVALASFLGARGVMQIIGLRLAPGAGELALPPLLVGRPTALAEVHATSADSILSRNPFDSQTGPLNRPAAAAAPPPGLNSDVYAAPPCDSVKVLAIAASSDPEWSFTALSPGDDKTPAQLRRRGGDFNGRTVEFIGWDRVWLTTGAARCQSQLFKTQEAPPPPVAAPPPVPPVRGVPTVDPQMEKSIQRVGPHEFNVDRGVIEKLLGNQALLMQQARVSPAQDNGKTVGITLGGVPTRHIRYDNLKPAVKSRVSPFWQG